MKKRQIAGFCLFLAVAGAIFFWHQWPWRQTEQRPQLRIGVLLSLTGDVGSYGQRSLRGIQLAQEEINRSGGISKQPIALVIEDARSSPRDAVSAFNRLLDLDHVNVVIGDVLSGTTLAVAPIAEERRILLLAPGASNPALRDAGDYIFRNWVSDNFDGQVMAQYLLEQRITQVYILYQQTDYGKGLADAFQQAFARGGGNVIGTDGFATETADFRAQILKATNSGAAAAYLVGEARQSATILRQAAAMGSAERWFTNLTIDTPEAAAIAGTARDGVVFTTPAFDPNSSEPQVKKFVSNFSKTFGNPPEITSAVAYDAMMILAAAMRKCGARPDQIKKCLYAIKAFPGVTGSTSFDSHGDVSKDIFIKEIKNGHAILISRYAPRT